MTGNNNLLLLASDGEFKFIGSFESMHWSMKEEVIVISFVKEKGETEGSVCKYKTTSRPSSHFHFLNSFRKSIFQFFNLCFSFFHRFIFRFWRENKLAEF